MSRVRNPGMSRWSRTSRSTKASGRAAHASRVSHEGHVFGVNHVTSWSWTPRALSQRERGRPLTAGVRRTLGMTKGRPGVKSTIWRARMRRTACIPACTRRARWAYEQRPRSATNTSPACQLGCTAWTWAKSWVRKGAVTSFRSLPVRAWNSPKRGAMGKPHPGRGSVDWPKVACHTRVSGMEHPELSTKNRRWPGHRLSLARQGCMARLKRASRRSKTRRGSRARAWQ